MNIQTKFPTVRFLQEEDPMRCSKPVSERRLRSTMACRRLGQHRAAAATCFAGILRERVSKDYGGDRLAPPAPMACRQRTNARRSACGVLSYLGFYEGSRGKLASQSSATLASPCDPSMDGRVVAETAPSEFAAESGETTVPRHPECRVLDSARRSVGNPAEHQRQVERANAQHDATGSAELRMRRRSPQQAHDDLLLGKAATFRCGSKQNPIGMPSTDGNRNRK